MTEGDGVKKINLRDVIYEYPLPETTVGRKDGFEDRPQREEQNSGSTPTRN